MLKKLMNKTFFTGLGLLALSKEKFENAVQRMAEEGTLSEEKAREMMNRIMTIAEEEKGKLEERIQNNMEKLMKKAGFVSREEYENLQEEVAELKNTLHQLEFKSPVSEAGSAEETGSTDRIYD